VELRRDNRSHKKRKTGVTFSNSEAHFRRAKIIGVLDDLYETLEGVDVKIFGSSLLRRSQTARIAPGIVASEQAKPSITASANVEVLGSEIVRAPI